MEEERRAARRFLALAVAAGALGILGLAPQLRGVGIALVLPWALAVGGPAAVWLLHAPAASSDRAWLRLVAPLFVGAAGALALAEVFPLPTRRDLGLAYWLLPVALPAAWLAASVPAWRRSDAAGRAWTLASLAAFGLLFALRVEVTVLAFFGLEAALFLGLAGFRRSPAAWIASLAAGALVLLGGLAFVLALRGSLWPPRVVLDADEFVALVLPMVLAGAATACGTLLFWRGRRATDLGPSHA